MWPAFYEWPTCVLTESVLCVSQSLKCPADQVNLARTCWLGWWPHSAFPRGLVSLYNILKCACQTSFCTSVLEYGKGKQCQARKKTLSVESVLLGIAHHVGKSVFCFGFWVCCFPLKLWPVWRTVQKPPATGISGFLGLTCVALQGTPLSLYHLAHAFPYLRIAGGGPGTA